jgi:RsiW-degrading membrane proteinase PrsW (M82 family)
VLYVLSEETGAWERALVRIVLAVPAHAVNGVLMGYFLGRAKFSATPKRYHAAALATAASTHGLYDVFLLYDHAELLAGGALVVLAVAGWLSVRAIKQHVQSSPFRDEV